MAEEYRGRWPSVELPPPMTRGVIAREWMEGRYLCVSPEGSTRRAGGGREPVEKRRRKSLPGSKR